MNEKHMQQTIEVCNTYLIKKKDPSFTSFFTFMFKQTLSTDWKFFIVVLLFLNTKFIFYSPSWMQLPFISDTFITSFIISSIFARIALKDQIHNTTSIVATCRYNNYQLYLARLLVCSLLYTFSMVLTTIIVYFLQIDVRIDMLYQTTTFVLFIGLLLVEVLYFKVRKPSHIIILNLLNYFVLRRLLNAFLSSINITSTASLLITLLIGFTLIAFSLKRYKSQEEPIC